MVRRIVRAVLVIWCLGLMTLTVAVAQPRSPLVGIPHMSDTPDGPQIEKFPSGTDVVYLVFEYETDAPVEIIAEIRSEEQQGAVIFTSRETYSGRGTANIKIEGPGSAPFPDGVYDTIIRFGEKRYVTAGWEWAVGVELPPEDTSGGQAPISPREGSDVGSAQTNLQPASGTGIEANPVAGVQSSSPAPTTPGLSPLILGGVGLVVLILLAVIMWAVRGFMTAA